MQTLFRIILLAEVLFSVPAYAIVNVKSLHLLEPEPGFSGSVSLGLNGASGNSNQIRTKTAVLGQWYQPGRLNYIAANYAYGKTFGVDNGSGTKINVVDVNKWYTHIRHIHGISDRLDWEVFGQAESDEFTRLTYRGLAGGGVRIAVLPREAKQVVYLGTGMFYSQEEIKKQSNVTDSGINRNIKGNLYFIYKRSLSDNVTFQSTTYAQPVINDVKNFRLLEDANLAIKLTDNFALSIAILANFNNRPPQQVKKDDMTYMTSVEYEF